MKKIKCLRIIAFIMIFAVAFAYITECYFYPRSYVTRNIEAFYDEPKDNLDGVIIGTSVVGFGWAAPVAWYENGIAIANLGTSVQPFGAIPQIIEFTKTRQNIKYVIIDIHAIRHSAIHTSIINRNISRLYCSLHPGIQRYKMLKASVDYAQRVYDYYGYPENEDDIVSKNDFSLYFPFYTFHSRWSEGLKKADYVHVSNKYKGGNDTQNTFKTQDQTSQLFQWHCDVGELDDFQKNEFDILFDYLKETDTKALFVNYPSFRGEEYESELKAAVKYVEENGFDMIDMATEEFLEEADFDIVTDLFNVGHVNSKGSCKIAKYISDYIKDNYEYVDHRGEAGYESWDKAVNDYEAYLKSGWKNKTGEEFTFKTE